MEAAISRIFSAVSDFGSGSGSGSGFGFDFSLMLTGCVGQGGRKRIAGGSELG